MPEKTVSDGDAIQRNFYKELVFGSDQTEQEYAEEERRFSKLLFEECGIALEDGREMYATRKTLSGLEVKYAGGKILTRDDFILTLSLAKNMLRHEDKEGLIPFIIRNRKKHKNFSAIQHHPRFFLREIILQRFIDTEEMILHDDNGTKQEKAQDVRATLDFCLMVHHWNTEYYRRYPTVGVLFSSRVPEEKKFRAGEQANYLAWWRGLPYEISQELLEFRLLDLLDEGMRGRYLGELCAMSLEELFDETYFEYSNRPPITPYFLERPPRIQPAEHILRMIVGIYGNDPGVVETEQKVLKNEYQQYSSSQLATLRTIFSRAEDDLV